MPTLIMPNFDLSKTAFGETRLWVHAKLYQCNRDRRQALKIKWSKQSGVHALDECNTKKHKDICALNYHGENKRHNWQAYVLGHKKFHHVQTDLVEKEFNDFTDRNKMVFLLNGITYDMIDSVISTLGNIQSRKRKQFDSETLSKRWNIDRKKALKTFKRTTQRGIRTCLHPYLSRRYPKNDCMMCYNRLHHSMFSYTMESGVIS